MPGSQRGLKDGTGRDSTDLGNHSFLNLKEPAVLTETFGLSNLSLESSLADLPEFALSFSCLVKVFWKNIDRSRNG